jgi:hypothetical protein
MPLNPLPAKSAAARAYNTFDMVGYTIGAEGSNIIKVTGQLKDARGQAIAQVCALDVYLASDAAGTTITPTAPTSTLAINAKGKILAVLVTDKMVKLSCDVNGQFDLDITQTAAATYYMVAIMPDGSLSISSAITFV